MKSFPYGGQPQPFKNWERDMSLRDAIKISNVPIYKELAKRIGIKRIKKYLEKLDYGNHNPGTSTNGFWLTGPLEISAIEQALFLEKLATKNLPLTLEVQNQVIEILKMDNIKPISLYGKTGWTNSTPIDLGWWVGWINKKNKVYSFALNIDTKNQSDIKKRVSLGIECLKILMII